VETEAMLEHLKSCHDCMQQIEALSTKDALIDLIRQARTVSNVPTGETVDGLVQRLRELRSEATCTHNAPDGKHLTEFLAAAQAPDELGRLGPYRVLQVLGAGGMGVVFRAEDPQLARLVALKAMLPRLAAGETGRQRFLREARAAAALKHDHVVSIYQVGEDRGVPFLAMEFLEGEPVDMRLRRAGKLPAAEVLRIGREIALGLAAAHKRGLIHRDIKPANIWLEAETGRVKILDFGLARAVGQENQLTQEGAIIGTPAYMAPEQARGQNLDARCDLFSLGCVLYRMATGAAPFHGTDVVSTLMAVANETPRPPQLLEPSLPKALADLIVKLLAKEAVDRPESAQVVAHELDQIAGELVRPVPAASHRKWWPAPAIAASLLAMLAMVVAGIVFFVQTPDGVVRVEIDDPKITLSIEGHTATITNADKQPISLKPGTHSLTITRGDFTFDTTSFQLKKGDKTTLRIDWLQGKRMVVAQDGTKIGEKEADRTDGTGPHGAPPPAPWPLDAKQARAQQEAWARHLGVDVEIENLLGMKFRLIPPGEFKMGTPQEEIDAYVAKAEAAGQPDYVAHFLKLEAPQRLLSIDEPYYLGVHEVTQKAWRTVMESNPSANRNSIDLPVENITWLEAATFCNRLSELEKRLPCYRLDGDRAEWLGGDGYRLPLAEEWEYACRAGSTTKYSFGDDPASLGDYAWFAGNSSGHTQPVGRKRPNPFGLYDMHGNVWELVTYAKTQWKSLPKGSFFIRCRGGDYNGQPNRLRSPAISNTRSEVRSVWVGIRVVRPVSRDR
jgi:serine/threonine protein kinase